MALRLGSNAYVNIGVLSLYRKYKIIQHFHPPNSLNSDPFLSIQYNNSNFSVEKLHQVVLHNGYIYIEKANLCKVNKPSFILQWRAEVIRVVSNTFCSIKPEFCLLPPKKQVINYASLYIQNLYQFCIL